MEHFDYELLGHCQYPVKGSGSAEPETDCFEPAIARGNWMDEDGEETGVMLLCPEHLAFVLEKEKSEEVGECLPLPDHQSNTQKGG